MTQVISAAEARLLLGGKKALPAARAERKPPAPPKEPSPRKESLKTSETPEDTTPPPTVAETHYIGRYQLNVANGNHYPGRMRIVCVGPTDPKLLDYLTAALHQYTKQP